MDDAVRRYAKAAERMGFGKAFIVSSADMQIRGETGRWALRNGKRFWVPEAYALMESPEPVSGTVTGRWVGRSPINMQELPRKEKK